ncbi:hypothetical protein IAR50_000129 [Cryptococcus sp. DSM 104548]
MSTERQASPAPSQGHGIDEFSLIEDQTDIILDKFRNQLETYVASAEEHGDNQEVFHCAYTDIYDATRNLVLSTLQREVHSRELEGRIEGSIESVEVTWEAADVTTEENGEKQITLKGMSIYGKGWSKEQTSFEDLAFRPNFDASESEMEETGEEANQEGVYIEE